MPSPSAWPDVVSDEMARSWLAGATLENGGRVQGDLESSDRATAQTIALMCRHIRESCADPEVRAAAALARSGDARATAYAVYWLVKQCVQFENDDPLVQQWLGERDTLELLISPAVMVRMERPRGDCDDFTMLICALLQCAGIEWDIVTVAADQQAPRDFSHVFPRALLASGPLTLDASHGDKPGWEVPREHQQRRQEWGRDGRPRGPTTRPCLGRWRGLHGYALRRGLGDCPCSQAPDGYYCSDGTACTDMSGPPPSSGGCPTGYWCPNGNAVGGGMCSDGTACVPFGSPGTTPPGSLPGPYTPPAGTPTWLAPVLADINALTRGLTTSLPPGWHQLPNGQYVNAAGQIVSSLPSSSSSSSMLLWGVGILALVAVVAVAVKK